MAKRNQKKRGGAASSAASASGAGAASAASTSRAEGGAGAATAGAVEQPAQEASRRRRALAAAPRKPLARGSIGAIGAYVGIGFGVALVVLGILGAVRADTLPIPLLVALYLAGSLQAALCAMVLRRSRVAWSFAVALSGTSTLVCLFSAPKVRDALGLSIGVAILPSLVSLVVTWLLLSAAADVAQRD